MSYVKIIGDVPMSWFWFEPWNDEERCAWECLQILDLESDLFDRIRELYPNGIYETTLHNCIISHEFVAYVLGFRNWETLKIKAFEKRWNAFGYIITLPDSKAEITNNNIDWNYVIDFLYEIARFRRS